MFFFFFQAEDGIRDVAVTGVQTCALPISPVLAPVVVLVLNGPHAIPPRRDSRQPEVSGGVRQRDVGGGVGKRGGPDHGLRQQPLFDPQQRGTAERGRGNGAARREHDGGSGLRHVAPQIREDRKSTRLNSSHGYISYAVFCLKKKKKK